MELNLVQKVMLRRFKTCVAARFKDGIDSKTLRAYAEKFTEIEWPSLCEEHKVTAELLMQLYEIEFTKGETV